MNIKARPKYSYYLLTPDNDRKKILALDAQEVIRRFLLRD
jgi:hypothetical protein